jgi:hypothetical protein
MMSPSIHVLFVFLFIEFISAIVPYGQTSQAAYTCTFDGKQVPNAGWVTAYQSATVALGSKCVSQLRICVNGTLTGTYAYASCSVGSSASCTFNGKLLASGSTTTGYPSSVVPSGQTCQAQTVTCNNGKLSPANDYPTCTVGPVGRSYKTNFPTVQNPISEGGNWVTATTPGVNWSDLKTGGCACKAVSAVKVVAPGLAESAGANSNAGDALAVLAGTWGSTQSATATIANKPIQGEYEIHLRVNPETGQGYEITWQSGGSFIIVTWYGPGYNILYSGGLPAGHPAIGDRLTATINGNVITMLINGNQVVQYTDTANTFPAGNPGFGFNEGGGDYGYSNFSAASN